MEVTAIEANGAAMAVEAALVTGVATGVVSLGATDTMVVTVDIMEDIQVMERMVDIMAGLQVETMEDIQVDIKGGTSTSPAITLTLLMAMVATKEDPKLKLRVPAHLSASTAPLDPSVSANHKPVPQPTQDNTKRIKVT